MSAPVTAADIALAPIANGSREKLQKRLAPIVAELRQSIAATERALKDKYPPHVSTCINAACDHANRAHELLRRLKLRSP